MEAFGHALDFWIGWDELAYVLVREEEEGPYRLIQLDFETESQRILLTRSSPFRILGILP